MAEREEVLKTRRAEGLLRTLQPVSYRRTGRVYLENKEYADFSSNDYLGLAGHPALIEAARNALERFGTAASASRLLSGDLEIHHQLEERTARFKGKEAALMFNTGYQANVSILGCLYGKGDAVFSDRLNHASIIDGITLSGARFFRFLHNDLNHLEHLLRKEREKFKRALIVTETLFSMDGDRPPLKEMAALKHRYNCEIMTDEAHATGIFGKTGSGIVEEEGLTGDVDLIMGTYSKALASYGAYLAASRETVEYLLNFSRGFIYSTALPPAVVACSLASLELLKKEPHRRHRLLETAAWFRGTLKKNGFRVTGCSQIVPLLTGGNAKTLDFSARLREKGYRVFPVRPPTVPQGQARIRFSLTFDHDRPLLERLTEDIRAIRI